MPLLKKGDWYTEAVLEKTHKYIADYRSQGDMIPSICGLAVVLEVTRQTVHNWRNGDCDEFGAAIDKLLSTQERVLMNKGLSGDFNSNITKLALGKHGYHDKVDNTLGAGEKPLETKHTIEIIDGTPTDPEAV